MSQTPSELKYTKSHEWVLDNGNGTVTVGITDHAQDLLGDMVFIEVPECGRVLEAEEACAVVESVKAASDIYAPLSGEVTAVNEALEDSPELVNQDAFGEGWIMKMKIEDEEVLNALMDADAYESFLTTEA
ncbi:MAG: glycine cleavage system protein GcvH [Gammaproteobacteria bacterium]|nr:glycine cleavage system protein GcvH [Gammaproteobacteria bacterium]